MGGKTAKSHLSVYVLFIKCVFLLETTVKPVLSGPQKEDQKLVSIPIIA